MPVPKKRVSRTRRDKRRTHDSLPLVNPATCRECGASVMPHRICSECGKYKGIQFVKKED